MTTMTVENVYSEISVAYVVSPMFRIVVIVLSDVVFHL